ncbi:MAG: FAD-dependent oxidoreductase [Gammaproteobacteria bacterium]|nr:FAD-dependent oxidoreductase [Gammaproteobacteria bacterium]MDE0252583.1 FAD-dependent oxidoreductase [Gammaproteobacteria bacterium]MDE0403545.1 FAD-dependent oxidoreductase [Gammaproteobacteria bacterium]
MDTTNIFNPNYFHKVVDCQWACPAHTPVPEYIRLVAQGRYTEAYMVNWESNVFPGILGRTCDRPCEPACRRVRTEEKPVAICRLKRVAADHKGDISPYLPRIPAKKNGKRIALFGSGPASLAVARDLLPFGYEIDMFEKDPGGGGMMRSQIPAFRLPADVLEEEVDLIVNMGINTFYNYEITSMKEMLDMNYDAYFVGTGAPRGRDLDLPGRKEVSDHIFIGIDWLSSVAFGHTTSISGKVIVMGGGNTAMDCCRTSKRLGAETVTVVVRSGFDVMKASDWEKEDAMAEGIPILNNRPPKEFIHENGKLKGVMFERVQPKMVNGRLKYVPTGEPDVFIEADKILMAIGQENHCPWIERDIGIEFDKWDCPVLDKETLQSTHEKVFFGGDSAFGPENIIWASAHAHQAAISIHLYCQGKEVKRDRPPEGMNLISTRMGVHEWSYDSEHDPAERYIVPHADLRRSLKNIKVEVELGFDKDLGYSEAQRCLNCDVQTVFTEKLCIECDACVDICPIDCITFTKNGSEEDLRTRLTAPANNLEQDLYVSDELKTGRVMVKDEDLCLHCGLCAERCPTNAWDMQQSIVHIPQLGSYTE